MANSREPDGSTRSSNRILGNLDDSDDRRENRLNVGDMPLKLTEERIRAEWERNSRVADLDSVSLVAGREPRRVECEGVPEELPAVGVPRVSAQARAAQIPAPLSHPAQPRPDPQHRASAGRPSRVSRPLVYGAVIALTLALAGAAALDLRQNSVVSSRMSSAIRLLRAQAITARLQLQEFKRSQFFTEVVAMGHKARPVLAEVSRRAHELLGTIRDRYRRWRAQRLTAALSLKARSIAENKSTTLKTSVLPQSTA